jgi:hypothetical protein
LLKESKKLCASVALRAIFLSQSCKVVKNSKQQNDYGSWQEILEQRRAENLYFVTLRKG